MLEAALAGAVARLRQRAPSIVVGNVTILVLVLAILADVAVGYSG